MSAGKKGSELKLPGTSLGTRFSIQMSLALAVVLVVAGMYLYDRTLSVAQDIQENAFVEAVRMRGKPLETRFARIRDQEVATLAGGEVERVPVSLPNDAAQTGFVYTHSDKERRREKDPARFRGNDDYDAGYEDGYKDGHQLFVPASAKASAGQGLLGLILGVTIFVILIGALVAWMVGNAVSRPLRLIVQDIAQISRGDLRHRTRVRAGGEIMMLAKSIDRMAGNLEEAQAAQLELSVREREIALASEVREALLPHETPRVEGWDVAALHVDSPAPGGDFHDFVDLGGGRAGLLVCEASGRGIPGALIGAIARSYLRVELARGPDVAQAMSRVNRELARDVRRGMFVTAMFVVVDPAEGSATIACAGHKLPLVRFTAADGKLRLVQPEGIALGFDKGAVFDRALQVQRVPVEPGDRLVIANTGPVRVKNAGGEELGEKAFYRLVLHGAPQAPEPMLAKLCADLEAFAEGQPFPNDISIVAVARRT